MYGMSWEELLTPSVRTGQRSGQSLPPLTPQEEQTLLGFLLQKTQGALETVGNTLDLPGSMVRDLLAGQNPLDQLLTPFSSENRTMGTDLLNNMGLLPENDPTAWEVNDVLGGIAGLGAEIALDPLTYLTFGGSAAKTLAGKTASKAGLLDDVVKVGTAKAGRALGKREAMLMTSVDDLLTSLPETQRSLKQTALANAGYDAATMGDQALGSPLGWQIPFTDIGGAFGAGRVPKAASVVDEVSQAVPEAVPFEYMKPASGQVYQYNKTRHELFPSGLDPATATKAMADAAYDKQAMSVLLNPPPLSSKSTDEEMANWLQWLGQAGDSAWNVSESNLPVARDVLEKAKRQLLEITPDLRNRPLDVRGHAVTANVGELESFLKAQGAETGDVLGREFVNDIVYPKQVETAAPVAAAVAPAGATVPLMQRYARGLDTVGEYLSNTAPVRAVRSLFDPSAGDTLYGPGQRAAGEIAGKKENLAFQTQQDAYDAVRKMGPEAGHDTSIEFFVEHPEIVDMEGDAAFTRRGLKPLSPEAQQILRENVLAPKEEVFQRRAELGHAPDEHFSEFGVGHSPRYMNFPNVPTPGYEPRANLKAMAKNTGSDMHRNVALDVPGGRVAVNEMSQDPLLVGKDALDGDERIAHVLKQQLKWMPDLRDDYLAQGLDPDRAFKAEIDDALKARSAAQGEYVSDSPAAPAIREVAEKFNLKPQAVEAAISESLAMRNEEFRSVYQPWKDFWDTQFRGNIAKRGNFWKAFYKAEDPDALQRMGWKFDEFADAALRRGVIGESENPTDALWKLMQQHGSPSTLRKMTDARPKIPKNARWIEGELRDPQIQQMVLDMQMNPAKAVPLDETQEAMLKFYDRAKETSDYLKGVDPKRAEQKVGVFGNHVLKDNEKYLRDGRTVIANLEGIHQVFADEATAAAGPDMIPLQEAFALAKFKDPARAANTLQQTLKTLRKEGAAYVPKDAVEWATKTLDRTVSPESVTWLGNLMDQLTNVWKLGSTAAPAFHVRNFVGGVVQNLMEGFIDPTNANRVLRDVRTALDGGTIKGLASRVPAFKGLTDEQATQKMLEMADSLGVFQSQLDETHVAAKANLPKPGNFEAGVVVKALDRQNRGKILEALPNDEFRVQFTGERNGKTTEAILPRRMLVWERAGQGPVDFGGATPLERMMNRIPGRGAPVTLGGAFKQFGSDVKSGFDKLLQGKLPGELNPAAMAGVGGREADEFALGKLQRNIGNFVEGQNRLSALQGLLEKGYEPLEAKKLIDAAHVDYGNLTSFEKQYMRRAMPFYSFTRRMTEHVVNRLLERPGGPYGMAIRAANAPRQNDVYVPDYISEGTAIPLGPGRFVTGLGLMHEAPFNLAASGPTTMKTVQRTGQKLGSMLNPLFKLPIEMATGTSLYTGRPLRDLYQYPFEGGGDAVLANLALSNSPLGRTLSSARKLTDTRKDPLTKGLNLLTGVQIADQSGGPERAKEFAARKVTDDYLRDNPKFGTFERIYPKKGMLEMLTPTELDLWRFKTTQEKKAREAAKERASQAT